LIYPKLSEIGISLNEI